MTQCSLPFASDIRWPLSTSFRQLLREELTARFSIDSKAIISPATIISTHATEGGLEIVDTFPS